MKALYSNLLGLGLSLVVNTALSYEAPKTATPPALDGIANDQAWQKAPWQELDKHIIGEYPSADDFSGRYKLSWDKNKIYLLAEITDDVLYDVHPNPLDAYWDDDCLEIFIDEDKSGGDHKFNFNAFAYHLSLDNQAIDIGPNKADGSVNFIALNDHITSIWKRQAEAPHKIIWEVAINIYADNFKLNYAPNEQPATPVILTENKTMGFMLAYCDNDGSKEREHFIGSHEIKPVNGDKNLGFIDAGVFGELKLVE